MSGIEPFMIWVGAPQAIAVLFLAYRSESRGDRLAALCAVAGFLVGACLLAAFDFLSHQDFQAVWMAWGWPNILHAWAIVGFVVAGVLIARFYRRTQKWGRIGLSTLLALQGVGVLTILLGRLGIDLIGRNGFGLTHALAMFAIFVGVWTLFILPFFSAFFLRDLVKSTPLVQRQEAV